MAVELLAGTKVKRETERAIIACNDYLRLGAGRSIAKLIDRYQNATEAPPSTRLKTLKDWSRKFGWQARAAEYDAKIEQVKNEERDRILAEGLALDYERIKALNKLAELLDRQLYETDDTGKYVNLWVTDVKGIGRGVDFEKVNIVRFNSNLVLQLRGVLDDIAQEIGGRKKKIEHGTEDDKPFPIRLVEVVLDSAVVGDDEPDG